jgi:UDP-N-acetylglucosamine:LPS N-acetylglucosamine transferase
MDGRDLTRRVLVVSASMGAGHTDAARELVRRLEERGHVTREVDVLALPSLRQGDLLRSFYFMLVRRAPAAYDRAMRAWERWPGFFETVTALGARSYERGLVREIARWRPDVVVATFDLAAQALGRLRARGRVDVPLVTFVTDPGAHPYWVSPHVNVHLTVTAETARDLREMGAAVTVATGPLVAPAFGRLPDRGKARAEWGLPQDACVALVSAGSWGVGDVGRCVGDLVSRGDVLPVVLCGHNRALARRMRATGSVVAVEWTDQVPALMSAADVLVDNAGGLTCLQALVAGLPVVVYRPIPGHGRYNAATLTRAGLARPATDAADLVRAVTELATPGWARDELVRRGQAIVASDPADHVLAVADRARR